MPNFNPFKRETDIEPTRAEAAAPANEHDDDARAAEDHLTVVGAVHGDVRPTLALANDVDEVALTPLEPGRPIRFLEPGDPIATAIIAVHLRDLIASPLNPRKRDGFSADAIENLAGRIADQGLLQNLVVRPNRTLPGPAIYEVVAGGCRLAAMNWLVTHHINDWTEDTPIPVQVRELSDSEALRLALVENEARTAINPLDEAEGLLALRAAAEDEGLDVGEVMSDIAATFGKDKRWVEKRIKLARNLCDDAKDWLARGDINLAMAHEISTLGWERQAGVLQCLAENVPAWETAEAIKARLAGPAFPRGKARFNHGDYDHFSHLEGVSSAIDYDEDEEFYTDLAQVARLQHQAATALTEDDDALGLPNWSALHTDPTTFHSAYTTRPPEGADLGVVVLYDPTTFEIEVRRGVALRGTPTPSPTPVAAPEFGAAHLDTPSTADGASDTAVGSDIGPEIGREIGDDADAGGGNSADASTAMPAASATAAGDPIPDAPPGSNESAPPKKERPKSSEPKSPAFYGRQVFAHAARVKTSALQAAVRDAGPAHAMALTICALLARPNDEDNDTVRVRPQSMHGESGELWNDARAAIEHAAKATGVAHLIEWISGLPETIDAAALYLALVGDDSTSAAPALDELFTTLIAAHTGALRQDAGDSALTLAVARALNADRRLMGDGATELVTTEYLANFSVAQLTAIAGACLAISDHHELGDELTAMPRKHANAVEWLLRHPARDPDWMPPEMQFATPETAFEDINDLLEGAG